MAAVSGIISVMQKAARKAAPALRRDFNEVEQLQVSKKGPADFVSQADKNLTWTIMALAWRTSEFIADERRKGTI